MAKAYKCDICGQFFEEKPTVVVVGGLVSRRMRANRENVLVLDNTCDFLGEICQDCRASFIFWKDSRNPSRITVFEDKEDVNMFDGC